MEATIRVYNHYSSLILLYSAISIFVYIAVKANAAHNHIQHQVLPHTAFDKFKNVKNFV